VYCLELQQAYIILSDFGSKWRAVQMRNGTSRKRIVKRQTGQHKATRKIMLITTQHLDGRSGAAKQFNQIVRNVTADLGGNQALTEIERHLITSFAGAAILQGHQLVKMLAGQATDIDEYAAITTTMVRSATRLGTQRRQKNVVPRLKEYAQQFEDAAE
jgi:hypothetical protein